MTIRFSPGHMGSSVTTLIQQRVGSGIASRDRADWDWDGPPGTHSPFPRDTSPYPGHAVQYCFIDIMAAYKIMGE